MQFLSNFYKHKLKNKKLLLTLSIVIVSIAVVFIMSSSRTVIDFNTQIKPIINKNCIACHGGVKRQAELSFLFRSEALKKTKSGKYAIIPGDPDHSEMIRRVNLKDPEERMPYKHDPLSEHEIELLRKWIEQGAQWGNHWAYVPVKKEEVPKPTSSLFGLIPAKKIDWVKNDIDYFIYDRLKSEDLQPSTEADKPTLLRRVSLDITGLPPSEKIAQQFLNDTSSNAYEKLVDALLASPHYGEHYTAMWLDLARYADTKGYERDDSRSIWKYRDYVINAFNNDKPYDQFLIEQLAGDLLPNATDDQFIATAFNRNTMTNDEGGTDNEEFRTAAVIDRVNTTWQTLMGTTFGCVQCHSHPYDPFKHEEYYKFLAFFNDSRDEDTYADYPLLREYKKEDSSKLFQLVKWLNDNGYNQKAKEVYRFLKTWQPAINSLTSDSFINSELSDTKWLIFRNNGVARLKSVNLDQRSQLIYRYNAFLDGGIWTIHLDKPDGPVLKIIKPVKTKGWTISNVDFPKAAGVHDLYFTYTNSNLKKPDASGMMFDWFYFTEPLPGNDKAGYVNANKIFWELLNAEVKTTPVMMDNPSYMHRTTNVFVKGNWLVKGEVVQPDVPQSLNPFPNKAPRNRLGMAQWLTSKQNPLTARTMVNRIWEQLFGSGLVETLEDMGTQGATPTHKELLDYLSWNFMNDYGWSVKKLIKQIVMSATYRQDSKLTKELLEKDPYNKFYAKGARVRLSAEQVRDQALSISGLLSEKMFGPSVMPWQPKGIWLSPWNGQDWKVSAGDDQYRRSVYTYWKRTAPYPSMLSFDGVNREVCTSRRIRTNTPLQALVTLNDSVYLDASRHFAYRMQEGNNSKDVKQMIQTGYEIALKKSITQSKLEALEKLYNKAYAKFSKDAERTCAMIGMNDKHNNPETAALVIVANAILNLDEVITKN
jgi:Protein of unknown function (DUF1553)./Protein of unknown function (DUF1549)./Planctomycete cytochrome C.